MNKLGVVLGVAAVATFSGCLDPNYSDRLENALNGGATTVAADPGATETAKVSDAAEPVAVISVDTATPVEPVPSEVVTPVETDGSEAKAPEATTPVAAVPADEVTTVYIVQRGDYLAKISKKYNVKIDAIKKLNPEIKADNIVRLGQKIKLPGKIDVGEQTVPAGAVKAAQAKVYTPYQGETKEYVVKAGDTLGAIAYGNGINVRQLKELNGLNDNMIRIGQKLLIPASAPAKASVPAVKKTEVKESVGSASSAPAEPVPAEVTADAVAPEAAAPEVAPAVVEEGPTHIVKEGEDLLGLALIYSLDPAEIRALNNLGENENTLKPGQVIKLPADANL